MGLIKMLIPALIPASPVPWMSLGVSSRPLIRVSLWQFSPNVRTTNALSRKRLAKSPTWPTASNCELTLGTMTNLLTLMSLRGI